MPDWNKGIIEEFRANGGKVGGQFKGAPLLILKTKGAKTGLERANPMMYQADGDRFLIFASKGGSPTHPDWYHNLLANPRATVEVGDETFDVDAEVLTGEERDRFYAIQAERYPGFADYEVKTDGIRTIPVIALVRAD
jgi:deazaflavin-dependent oxidoreductase (nitroreductase family)